MADEDAAFQSMLAASRPSGPGPVNYSPNTTAGVVLSSPDRPSYIRSNTEPSSYPSERETRYSNETVKEQPRRRLNQNNLPSEQKKRTVQRFNTTGNMPGITSKAPARKRKAGTLQIVPESQQVFKGLIFCMKMQYHHVFSLNVLINIHPSFYSERRYCSCSTTAYPTCPRIRRTVDSTMGQSYHACNSGENSSLSAFD